MDVSDFLVKCSNRSVHQSCLVCGGMTVWHVIHNYTIIYAVGFHYETYIEISPTLTLLFASLLSLILPFQIDIRTRKCILHRQVWRDGLISALVATSSPRLEAPARCGDLC